MYIYIYYERGGLKAKYKEQDEHGQAFHHPATGYISGNPVIL